MGILKRLLALSTIATSAAFIYRIYKNRNFTKTANLSNNNTNLGEDSSNQRTQRMFKDLQMTEAQKKKYENSINKVLSDWGKENPNSKMDIEKTINEEDKVLNDVLNEVQYGLYREWAAKH